VEHLVVNGGSLDILPDYFTLPDCCPLCYRPSDFQFADYLHFPDDPFNSEPTASSSSNSASWTPPQPEFGSNDVSNLNNVFFGSDFHHSDAQHEPNPLQPSDWGLFSIANGFLPDCTNDLSLSTAHQALESSGIDYPNMNDGNLIGEPSLAIGISETDVLHMNGLDDLVAPNSTPSNVSPLFNESAQEGDMEPYTAATTLEMQNLEAFQISDAGQVTLPPSPSGRFICSWRGCQTPFSRVAELRLHVRSHTKGAERCLWDGCRRLAEPVSALNKHLDSHTKPHLCPEAGCGHRAAKLRDMRRHTLKHGISNGTKVYHCPASDCQYFEGCTPFLRADNARRHIRQIHPGSTLDVIIRTYRK
jgi:hypothetical protein